MLKWTTSPTNQVGSMPALDLLITQLHLEVVLIQLCQTSEDVKLFYNGGNMMCLCVGITPACKSSSLMSHMLDH